MTTERTAPTFRATILTTCCFALATCLTLAAAPALASGDDGHENPVLDEVNHHFDGSWAAYQAGEMDRAAEELRTAGAYVHLQTQRVESRLDEEADPAVRHELRDERRVLHQTEEAITSMARDLSWFGAPAAEDLEKLFVDTNYTLAAYHHRQAAEALELGQRERAALHLRMVADYMEQGARLTGSSVAETAPMAAETRRVAESLRHQSRITRESRAAASASLQATDSMIRRLPH